MRIFRLAKKVTDERLRLEKTGGWSPDGWDPAALPAEVRLLRHDFSGPNYMGIHSMAANASYLDSVMGRCNRCGEMVEFRFALAEPLPVEWSCRG